MNLWRTTIPALLAFTLLAALPVLPAGAHEDVPFGEPTGPIPFPVQNISSSPTEDHSPRIFADGQAMRVLWNKGFHEHFEHQVAYRENDGTGWRPGDEWISVPDVQYQVDGVDPHDAHEAVSVEHDGLVYFIFATDDPDQTDGLDHDIAMRTMDPDDRSWSPIVDLTPGDVGQDRHPAALVMDGRLVVAWSTNDPGRASGGDEDIVMATLEDGALSDIVIVSGADEKAKDWQVDMALVDGVLALTWSASNLTVRPDDHDVLFRRYDGSAFMGPPVLVSTVPERSDRFPQVAQVSSGPMVVWESSPPASAVGEPSILGRVLTGDGFGPLVHFSPSGGRSNDLKPDVVFKGGTSYVLWATDDDSISHGADFDIVMRAFDGVTLGDVVEVSHPLDGNVSDGGVSACIFQGNIYAVWNVFFPSDDGHDHPDEEVAFRRVTDVTAEIDIPEPQGGHVAGGVLQVRIRVQDFSGEAVPLDEGFALHILDGHEPLLVGLSFQPEDGGWYSVVFRSQREGVHTALLVHEGRELATAQVDVGERATGEPGLPPYLPWAALVLILIVSVSVLVVATRM